MKRLVPFFLFVFAGFFVYAQNNLTTADNCFKQGDYECARTHYRQLLAKTPNDGVVKSKYEKANLCAIYLIAANDSFQKKNYADAKINYIEILKLNPDDPYVKSQLEKCNDILIQLSVSPQNLTFTSSGGTQSVMVRSNAAFYDVEALLPDWCSVSKHAGQFDVICQPHTGSAARKHTLVVTAEGKKVAITINQSGVTINLKVSPVSLDFNSYGGKQNVTVTTNASSYEISNVPPWCSVVNNAGYFVLTCSSNPLQTPRSEKILVKAGNLTNEVRITQTARVSTNTGISNTQNSNYPQIYARKRCFNCPKGDARSSGLSFGYVQKQWEWDTSEGVYSSGIWNELDSYLNGFQVGIRIEPLFKYGFGLSTGLFYTYYRSQSERLSGSYYDPYDTFFYHMTYTENSLFIPFYLEYRFNFAENFQLFVEAGPSIDYGLNAKLTASADEDSDPFFTEKNLYSNSDIGFPIKKFNLSLDFGAGIRIYGVQINVGLSNGIIDVSNNSNMRIKQNKIITASLSFMMKN